jgi:prepilin-type N-terminal cleavage/methylation domain-containing protein
MKTESRKIGLSKKSLLFTPAQDVERWLGTDPPQQGTTVALGTIIAREDNPDQVIAVITSEHGLVTCNGESLIEGEIETILNWMRMLDHQPLATRTAAAGEHAFTLIELLIVVGILLVLVAIAVPSYLAAKRSSNGSAAASSIEGYNKAVQSYTNEWGVIPNGAAADMGGAQVAPPTPACLTGGELTSADDAALYGAGLTRAGYLFTAKSGGAAVGLGGCAGAQTYDIIATPSVPGSTGIVSYCVDQNGEWELPTPAAQVGPAAGVSCPADGFSERVGS